MNVPPEIAAVVGLWGTLTALGSAAIKWLAGEVVRREEQCKSDCKDRVAELEAKLDKAAVVAERQTVSMQKQIEAQQEVIALLREDRPR